jgi:ribosomal protein S18 acetylase RimI-like enzyme
VVLVSAASEVDAELLEALGRLLPQLSSSAQPLGAGEAGEIVGSTTTTLLVAREEAGSDVERGRGAAPARVAGGPIVGMLTLAIFRIPTGLRAWVEDVVVDERARGRGVGEALTKAALEVARARGAVTVDLTSRPSREAANRLYKRLGFEVRETNVYRYDFGRRPPGQ